MNKKLGKALEEALAIIAIAVSLTYLAWVLNMYINKGYMSRPEACKSYFGEEYVFVDGEEGPDICIKEDGDIKYFETIPVLE